MKKLKFQGKIHSTRNNWRAVFRSTGALKMGENLKFKEEIKENYPGNDENDWKGEEKRKNRTGALIVNASGSGARKRWKKGKNGKVERFWLILIRVLKILQIT